MNIRFLFKLKEPKSSKPTSIRLVIYHRDFKPHNVLYYGIGEVIMPLYFDTATQRPTKDKQLLKSLTKEEQRNLLLLEDYMNTVQSAARKVCERLMFHDIPFETDGFRMLLNGELGRKVKAPKSKDGSVKAKMDAELMRKVGLTVPGSETLSFSDYLDAYIKDLERGKRLTVQGKWLTEGSIKNYKTFRAQLMAFESYAGRRMDFKDFNQDFYNEFVQFLNGKNYSPNTIGKHIARLKKLLRSAREEDVYKGSEHEKKYFRTLGEETEQIYLSTKELRMIKAVDLSETPELEFYRDVFLIGCAIAQRVSDYKAIQPQHFTTTSRGVKIIKLRQRKTGEEVMIPIGRELDELLGKYDYYIPKVYEQKLNEALKVIGRVANISTPVEIEMVRGGKKLRKVFPKYELIKSHTARRTGATNMYLAGIPTIDIMKITGHKKESNFLKYICVTKEETADKLSDHPYFQ